LSTEEVVELAKKCFDYYKSNAKPKERTARFIDRTGIEEFKKNCSEIEVNYYRLKSEVVDSD
jgi:dissimilatory sulfite reductase (desulfoviridin) alpha/beta subunit